MPLLTREEERSLQKFHDFLSEIEVRCDTGLAPLEDDEVFQRGRAAEACQLAMQAITELQIAVRVMRMNA